MHNIYDNFSYNMNGLGCMIKLQSHLNFGGHKINSLVIRLWTSVVAVTFGSDQAEQGPWQICIALPCRNPVCNL